MHNRDFWNLAGWTLACAMLLIAGRKVTEWRQPSAMTVKVAFATAASSWLPPNAPNKLVVLQIPVVVEPRSDQPVKVKFRTTMPFNVDGIKEQNFELSQDGDERMAEGQLTIPAYVDRGWIQLKADFSQLTELEKLELKILEPEGAELGASTNHTASLQPKFGFNWNLIVNGQEVDRELELAELTDLSSSVRINRILDKAHAVKLEVLHHENGKTVELSIPAGKQDVDLSAAIRDLLPKKLIGKVDVRVTTTNGDGTSSLSQRWLVFPTPPPPPKAKLISLAVTVLDPPGKQWTENGGAVSLEIKGTFSPGEPNTATARVDLAGLVVDEDYRAAKLTVELSSENPRAVVEVGLINDEIPEPLKKFEAVAKSQDLVSVPLAIELRDDDPLLLEWASVADPAVAKEGTDPPPALRFMLKTSQTLPAEPYTIDLAVAPSDETRWSVQPPNLQLSNAANSAGVRFYVKNDDVYNKNQQITIAGKASGERQPSAGIRLAPLVVTVEDDDPETVSLTILVVYNDYLKQNWATKAPALKSIQKKIKGADLAQGAIFFLGKDKLVEWKEGMPEFETINHTLYSELLTDTTKALATIHARQKFRHTAILWYSSKELEPVKDPKFDFPMDVRPHLFWLDGGVASEWLHEHLIQPQLKLRPDDEPLLFYPDDVNQKSFIDRLVEYSKPKP